MELFFLFVLLALASYRLTRLITRDKLPLIDIPREAFVQRWGAYQDTKRVKSAETGRWWRWWWGSEFESVDGEHRTNLVMKSLAYLWECDWCMGIWVAGGLVFTTAQFVDTPYPYLQWLAAAAATGWLASREKQ